MREQVRKYLTSTSPHVRVSGFRNLENFCLKDPESRKILLMESGIQGFGIQNKAQVPHLGMKSRIQVPLEKTGIQQPESRILEWDPESKTVSYSLKRSDSRDLKQPGRVCGRRREKTSEVWVENVVQSGKNKCLSKLPSRLVAEVGRLH